MILIDISNIFYRSYYSLLRAQKEEISKNGFSPFSIDCHILLKSILKDIEYYKNRFKSEYGDNVILCCDGSGNWRNKYFKQYKQIRKENKQKDEIDWNYVMGEYKKVKDEIATNSTYIVLEIPELEADDLISEVSKIVKKPVIIISIDKDLNQLITEDIKQYSYIKNDFIAKEHHPLNEAILTGDTSDGVPNIFSDDDHFTTIDKKRSKPVSAKIKEYFNQFDNITEQNVSSFVDFYNSKNKEPLNKDTILHNFNRNKMMIDLDCIPQEYKSIIKEETKKAYNLSKLNIAKNDKWIQNILNEEQVTEDLTIGDLFD